MKNHPEIPDSSEPRDVQCPNCKDKGDWLSEHIQARVERMRRERTWKYAAKLAALDDVGRQAREYLLRCAAGEGP